MNYLSPNYRSAFSGSAFGSATAFTGGSQYRQLECARQGTAPVNLACPDFALPTVAYQAFVELRSIIRAPDQVIMAAILAAMSSACQWWIRVKPPHTDTPHVTTLAIYTGADSGSGKSPVMNRVFEPMRRIGLARTEKHKQDEKDRRADRLLFRAKQRSLLGKVAKLYASGVMADPAQLAQAEQEVRNLDDFGSPDIKPGHMVKGDISPSKLLDELNGTRASILMATDEGRKFFGKMTDEDMEMHNQVFDGITVSYERMHHTIVANEPLATYCAMTHLDVLDRFIKNKGNEARASGWLGRGLLSRALPRGRDLAPAVLHPTWPKTDTFNARSMTLLEGREQLIADSSFEPTTLEFDEAATTAFMEMLSKNNQLMASRDEWGLMQDFGRKHPSNVARIAAIFHYFAEEPGTLISEGTLMNAIRVTDWYIEQAKQILITQPMELKLKKLVSFLHDKCFIQGKHLAYTDRGQEQLIPLRWIMQFHNIGREELDPLLDILLQQDAIQLCNSYLGKRCVRLNPALFVTL